MEKIMEKGDLVFLIIAAIMLVVIPFLLYFRALHSDDTDVKMQTDMIAVCTGSDDVVGCIEALKTVRFS